MSETDHPFAHPEPAPVSSGDPTETADEAEPEPVPAPETAVTEPAAPAEAPPAWRRLPSGRWAVGDEGSQERILPLPSRPWSVPDMVADGGSIGGLTYRAASLRGLSHQQAGKPRQDAFAFRLADNSEWLIVCVADGVSEGRLSHEAARIVCEIVTRRLGAALADVAPPHADSDWAAFVESLPWTDAISEANETIVEQASAWYRRHAISEDGSPDPSVETRVLQPEEAAKIMSTTAIAVVIPTEARGDGCHPYTVAVAAGDSSAFHWRGEVWEPLTAVKNAGAEIASSAVNPLPRKQEIMYSHGQLEAGECLAVMTDGVGDPLGSGGGVVGRFLADVWSRPPDVVSFAAHVGFLRKTFIDDRTTFCVWATSQP